VISEEDRLVAPLLLPVSGENQVHSIRCGNVFGTLIAKYWCVSSGEKKFTRTKGNWRNGQVNFVN
jgi:hypothetical protein